MIRIVADLHIPYIASFLGDVGHMHLIPGRQITREDVREADVLVVRSVTKVDEALLRGSPVRYVATATSGVDHVDTEYLSNRGIEFSSAAGANAESVTEYVISALFALLAEQDSMLRDATIGIVGFGHVGSLLRRSRRPSEISHPAMRWSTSRP